MINLEKLILLGYNQLIKGYQVTKKVYTFSDGVHAQI